ncbi:MAG: hypothetical protein JST54_22175 [Deltaproteobacteria bacterium]|nr:hypothetical protein [Deltaproteobacteria bacterium]
MGIPPLVLLAAAAPLGTTDVRAGLIAAASALACWIAPATARWPLSILVAFGILQGGWTRAAAIVATFAALAIWPRPRTLGRRILVCLATTLIVALATRSAPPSFAALASVAVLLAPVELRAPRPLLALTLLVASVPGLWLVWQAQRARTAARASATDEAWALADVACTTAQWPACQEDAVVARALLARARGDDAAALAHLDRAPFPARPTTDLLHADAELAAGRIASAHPRLLHLAQQHPDASLAISPRGAVDWAHALLRVGKRAQAEAALRGVAGDEAEKLRAIASKPLDALPAGAHRFASAMELEPVTMPGACVKRGEVPPITLHWRVLDGFAADEDDWIFVHAWGPHTLGFDHVAGGRATHTLTPGESFDDPLTTPVPADAPAGSYKFELGWYEPASQLRLHPDDQPGHISFVVLGQLEVCP